MATKKISAMTVATGVNAADLVPIVQGGANKGASVDVLMGNSDEFLEGIRALGSVAVGRSLAIGMPTTTLTLLDGRVQVTPVYLKKATTLTGVKFLQIRQGDYTANNNNRIGLYTVSAGALTLVASCANNGNLWKGAAGWVSVPFAVPYAAAKGVYYVAYLFNNSATVTDPQIAACDQISVGGQLMDMTNSNTLAAYIVGADLVADGTALSTFSAAYLSAFFLLY